MCFLKKYGVKFIHPHVDKRIQSDKIVESGQGMEKLTMESDKEKKSKIKHDLAMSYFKQGYNCSQSVFLAFCEDYDFDTETALKISSSFGGGMGRLREVCGAVTGMFMAAGMLYGYSDPKDFSAKSDHYERIQKLAAEFESRNGSIICRELLGLGKGKDEPVPEKRTEEYYRKRPCAELVAMAASIFETYRIEMEKAADQS